MEFKKKTIIGEDNNEPPKNYIWAKSNGKFYEYGLNGWKESSMFKSESAKETTDAENTTQETVVEPVVDTSYQYLLRNSNKQPKYFGLYDTSEEAQTVFESNTIIGGDYQSPNASRLVVDFAKLGSLSLLSRYVVESNVGSIGFGFIWEASDNFTLEQDDIKGVRLLKTGTSFEVKVEYYDESFAFNPNGIYETTIGNETCYEYNPQAQ